METSEEDKRSKGICTHTTEDPDMSTGEPCRGGGYSGVSTSSSSSCHLCGYESTRHSNVVRHMKTMHETTQREEFRCCDTVFQDKAEYRNHCRQVHRDGHVCATCHRKFTRRALLRRHQSIHTGFKEFSCTSCSYASSHKSNLERHFKTHGVVETLKRPWATRNPLPDSTTTTGNLSSLGYHYPILRRMLRTHHRRDPTSTTTLKSKLSHSIESILNRKEVPKGIKTEVLLPPETQQPPSMSSSMINHSLSSPFNWTPSVQSQMSSNQGTPWSQCQDLRISSDYPQGLWWNPLLVTPTLDLSGNYFYPHYLNSGESTNVLL